MAKTSYFHYRGHWFDPLDLGTKRSHMSHDLATKTSLAKRSLNSACHHLLVGSFTIHSKNLFSALVKCHTSLSVWVSCQNFILCFSMS